MRRYAYLKEPLSSDGAAPVFKIMLYETDEGVYLFEYGSPDALTCSADRFYASAEDAHEDWDALIDERGWTEIEDPPPGCQHDAFVPVRVKGRDRGAPEWGSFEILRDGKWVGLDDV